MHHREREGQVERVDESESGTITVELKDAGGGLGGNYSIIIEAVDCPGAVAGSPIDRDSGNSWTLTVDAVFETKEEVEQG